MQFFEAVTPEETRKEKAKARELRASAWWKRKRSAGVCHFCGGKFAPAELTMEHVVPVARGGKSVKGNVVPACKECNNRKKYLLPIEWEDYMRKVSAAADDGLTGE